MAIDLTDKTSNSYDFSVTAGTVSEELTEIPTVTGNVASANFDVSSTLTCGTDFTDVDGSDFTVELWLKQKGTAGDRVLANKNGFAGLNIYIQDDDKIICQVNSTSGSTTATITTTSWTHLAFVYTKSAGTVKIYQEGSLLETVSSLSTGGIPNNASAWSIQSNASNGFYIDEYRLWNDVRTGTEITNNKDVRLVGNEAGLVLYLPMESLGSASASASPSLSPSASLSFSASQSPSSSVSASLSPSSSASSSLSPSASQSPSSSVSASPSSGYTGYSRGDEVSLPTNDNDLETTYDASDITDVSSDNGVRVGQTGTLQYMIHQFKNFVPTGSCLLEWNGQSSLAPSSSTVYLQIYNRNTTTWDTVDSDSASSANVDFTLDASVADLTNYKNTSQVISCRVYQEAI